MLFYLLGRGELRELFERLGYPWDDGLVERTIEYYMERTSHGSTLSKMVFASVIHELDCDEGCRLFLEALRSDIEDVQGGTTAEGIHLGAMAGTVAIVLHRYGGVELGPDGVSLSPEMPARIPCLRFRVHWCGRWLDVDLTAERMQVSADRDLPEPIPIAVDGVWHSLESGEALEFELAPRAGPAGGATPAGSQARVQFP